MHVEQNVDAVFFSKRKNVIERLQIAFVVLLRFGLQILPGDRKTDEIEAVCPVLFEKRLVQRIAERCAVNELIVDIHPVENPCSALLLHKP